MKKLSLFVLLSFLLSLIPSFVEAATSVDVTITATPTFVAISISPTSWILNGLTGDHRMRINTTYYSNPLGDTISPSATVLDAECLFTLVNSSTRSIDVTIDIADSIGGNHSTNSNTGLNGPTSFGSYSYASGLLFVGKVVAKSIGSPGLISDLAPLTNKKFGLEVKTQSDPWLVGTASSSITTVTATEH